MQSVYVYDIEIEKNGEYELIEEGFTIDDQDYSELSALDIDEIVKDEISLRYDYEYLINFAWVRTDEDDFAFDE